MYCNNCGAQNQDYAKWCSNCGAALSAPTGSQGVPPAVVPPAGEPPTAIPPGNVGYPPPPPVGPPIESYLIHSILVTVLCCLPLGIVAIVYAVKANNMIAARNVPAAMEASKNAKMWCWIAGIAGIVLGLGWFLIAGLSVLGRMH